MVVVIIILLPLLSLLPWAHLLAPCKNKRERKINEKGQKGKTCSQGFLRKRKEGFQFRFNKRGLVGSLVVVPLGGLIVNLLSRFSWHDGAYQNDHFLEQRKRIMTIVAPTSTCNKTRR